MRKDKSNISRRQFLSAAGGSLAAASLGSGLQAAKRDSRPNILLIVTDQESWMDRQTRGLLDMPANRWLYENGTSFSSFYCTTAQCTPARSTIQTGLYPHQTRHVANTNKKYCAHIPEGVEFLGNKMRQAGYFNGYGGKWHLLEPKKRLGVGRVLGGTDDAAQDDYFKRFMKIRDESKPWFYQAHFLNPHDIYHMNYIFEGEELPDPENATKWLKGKIKRVPGEEKRAKRILKRLGDKLSPPPGWDKEIEGIPPAIGDWAYPYGNSGKYKALSRKEKLEYWKKYRALYYSLHEMVDEQIGDLLNVLKEDYPEQFRNTIIIRTADHGDMSGEHESLKYKGPVPFDAQMHIQLILAGPGIPKGKEIEDIASQADLAATICELAGAEKPNEGRSDAESLVKAIKTSKPVGREYVFIEYYFLGAVQPLRIIRSKDYKYAVHYAENKTALFDYSKDPWERNNLSGNPAYSRIENKLKNELIAWQKDMDDPVTTDKYVIQEWKNPRKG
ncbi:sulfatase [Sedimentisphaera salicampi]|uniref:Choline-sulfatase n=1 Tax=Sedimentisphaera salicampi TaxID=1941349 RepID=A0A1W6LNR7_9BACT|nr:sulfatase-like hydrolase/transferase [Sedimentisphaera salicampi]ARN57401.1 Choline-sulfatase [Sedimentisphaera salicampi]